jgi:hypothetical protein
VIVALREASDDEIARVFRVNAEHVIATVDGAPAVYLRFQAVSGRRWALMNMLSEIKPSMARQLFYVLRSRLREECEPIFVLAETERSPRLLRLIGLLPTGEVFAGKEVWRWTPEQ